MTTIYLSVQLFLVLFASHVFSDFLLQMWMDGEEKKSFWILLKDGLINGLMAYVLVGDWRAVGIIPLIAVVHMLIDRITTQPKSGPIWFLMAQFLHIIFYAVLAILFHSFYVECYWFHLYGSYFNLLLILLSGFVLTVFTTGTYLGLVLRPLIKPMKSDNDNFEERGLQNGGRLIGRLERALIFLFTLSGQLMAVGFLVTAKSILRFGELKDGSNREEAEYIIIGTLYSFFLALLISLATASLMKWVAAAVASK